MEDKPTVTIEILYTDGVIRKITDVTDYVLDDANLFCAINSEKHFVNINHVMAWKIKENK